jgi:hypothetical protein
MVFGIEEPRFLLASNAASTTGADREERKTKEEHGKAQKRQEVAWELFSMKTICIP